MRLESCHIADDRTLHLSHTRLVAEALCGVEVGHDGEPELAVICVECFEYAQAAEIDISAWFIEALPDEWLLPVAA